MIDSVFISDLHLHPKDLAIFDRFVAFIEWVKRESIKKIYILGDFFHAWAGDDAMDEWSKNIALQLHDLVNSGVALFYMHGNRDFLLGNDFAKVVGWTTLSEPSLIELGGKKVLLVHGDRYCTKDKAHQCFRHLTRNKLFIKAFLRLPISFRIRVVNKVRQISQGLHYKAEEKVDVVSESVINHMTKLKVDLLIHGHTHKSGLTRYNLESRVLKRYVLSDWDDSPQMLCYDISNGIFFNQLT